MAPLVSSESVLRQPHYSKSRDLDFNHLAGFGLQEDFVRHFIAVRYFPFLALPSELKIENVVL